MVMRTLRIVELEIPVKNKDIHIVKETLEKEFGQRIDIRIENGCLIVSGEQISNYKVHDRILELTEGV